MVAARRVRCDRKIQNTYEGFCSRARPARVLVNRREHDLFIIRYQCLGAIAMVCVEIPNRHPLNLPFYRGPWPRPGVGDAGYSESIKRRDRNVAEVTKPHRAIAQGMVTGRPHQTGGACPGGCRASW